MTYTGDVTVGGPADMREIPGLTVTKLAVGPYDNNAYLLRDGTGRAAHRRGRRAGAAARLIGDTPVAARS